MKKLYFYPLAAFLAILCSLGCKHNNENMEGKTRIHFLHHSTGKVIWIGNGSKYLYRLGLNMMTDKWFKKYNKENGTNYDISESIFPKEKTYGWKNYPFDYYNIWVKNAGPEPYLDEPTLEILTQEFDVIIWKHCYPVSRMVMDSVADIDSEVKSLQNYKLQYEALKNKMHEFPEKKFIVWTGAALAESKTTRESALLAKEFFDWVRHDWDEKNDNIFLWDFYELETEGGLYLREDYAKAEGNSHPGKEFAANVTGLFCNRIVDVIEGRGDTSSITGK